MIDESEIPSECIIPGECITLDYTKVTTVDPDGTCYAMAYHHGGSNWPDSYYSDETDHGSDAVEEALKELRGEDDDSPSDNYQCRQCGAERHVDDHKRETRSWCDSDECDDIEWHERLDSHPNENV